MSHRKKNNHGAHTNRLLRRIGQTWGEWEHRPWVATHERAPKGLVDAWCNDRFAVQHYSFGGTQWLAIKRHHDGARDPTWAELQRIKNEIIGDECEAVQVFPKESELVDQADLYHLWLWPGAQACPFSFVRNGWAKPNRAKTE